MTLPASDNLPLAGRKRPSRICAALGMRFRRPWSVAKVAEPVQQLQEIGSKTIVADWIRPDLDLLITVGRFWGADAVKRFRFVEAPERHEPSMMATLLDRLRG